QLGSSRNIKMRNKYPLTVYQLIENPSGITFRTGAFSLSFVCLRYLCPEASNLRGMGSGRSSGAPTERSRDMQARIGSINFSDSANRKVLLKSEIKKPRFLNRGLIIIIDAQDSAQPISILIVLEQIKYTNL